MKNKNTTTVVELGAKIRLVKFNPAKHRIGTPPAISVSGKAGFRINRRFSDMANLRKGMYLTFFQDANRPSDWYLSVGEKDGQFKLGMSKTTYTFSSICLQRAIMESAELEQDIAWCIPVASEPVVIDGQQVYALITKAAYDPKNKKK